MNFGDKGSPFHPYLALQSSPGRDLGPVRAQFGEVAAGAAALLAFVGTEVATSILDSGIDAAGYLQRE